MGRMREVGHIPDLVGKMFSSSRRFCTHVIT